jgi:ribonuclease HI
MLEIYTDGACSNNGKPYAIAGIGIFWGTNHQNNLSMLCPKIMKQTNNVAELYAIYLALKQISEINPSIKAIIYSDSLYSVNVCNYVYTPIKNKDLINRIKISRNHLPNVKIIHIKADSHPGNIMADKLARASIKYHRIY